MAIAEVVASIGMTSDRACAHVAHLHRRNLSAVAGALILNTSNIVR